MRKLVLVMPSETYVDPEDFSRIVKMLRLSTELRDLRVLCDSSSRPGMAIQSWMLEGHTFKLTTFANSYFSYGRMEKFLASQPEIETLHIVRKYSAGLDGTLMPNLKNLHCSISAGMSDLYGLPSAFHNKSNWERLRVTMSFLGHSQELERFSRWIKTQFGSTLKCLSISTHLLWHWQDWIEESMANVAKHLPGIKFLEITDYTTSATLCPGSSPTYITTLFTQIETLILRPPMLPSEGPSEMPTISSWRTLQTEGGRLSVATRIMETLPTLKWLVLVGSRNYEYTRTPSPGPSLELLEVQVDLDEDEWLKT